MDAHQIATLIHVLADATSQGKVSLGDASGINKALWAIAREQGHGQAVDGLLQEWSAAEMDAAIAALLPQDGSTAI